MSRFSSICLVASFALAACLPIACAEDGAPTKTGDAKAEKGAAATGGDRPHAAIKTNHGTIIVELFRDQAPKTVSTFLGLAEGTLEFEDHKTKKMVKRPFYDGLIFHRVIKGFMIQGGCQRGDGGGGIGKPYEDEINPDSLGLDKLMAFSNGKPHPRIASDQRSLMQVVRGVVQPQLLKDEGIAPNDTEAIKARQQELNTKMMERLNKMSLKAFFQALGYKYNSKLKSSQPTRGVIACANAGPNTNGSQFFINLVDTPHLAGKHTVFGRVVKGMDIVDKIGKVKVAAGSRPVEQVTIQSIRAVAAPAKEAKGK